ncbi:MAG: CAAX prenyl protease-related protein [Verrucomicrobiota bacterium]
MFGSNRQEKAFLSPFIAFLAVMLLGQILPFLLPKSAHSHWIVAHPIYWIIPLQSLVCGFLLLRFWSSYSLRPPRGVLFASAIGILSLILWIAPQQWFHAPPRLDGFNPNFFGGPASTPAWPFYLNLSIRFFRLVVIVPLVEEIFWRGFLLRYFIDDDFHSVPFGSFTWKSSAIVTAGFCLEHSFPDWPAAIATGILFNLVAYRTKSLAACVLTHAVTNLLLGFYVLHTSQWGFW